MPELQASSSPPASERLRVRARRVVLALLFGLILLIPRLARLRRRPRIWSAIRALMLALGVALVWRFAVHADRLKALFSGIGLIAFGALVRARRQTKSVDDVAREMGALVTLNGGILLAGDGTRAQGVRISISSERLIILNRRFQQVLEIPVTQLREIQVRRASGTAPGRKREEWDLRVTWGKDKDHEVNFRYEGTFAEHLASVAADTIRSVWKTSLPIVSQAMASEK